VAGTEKRRLPAMRPGSDARHCVRSASPSSRWPSSMIPGSCSTTSRISSAMSRVDLQ
jgi:hypothetical protein